MQKKTKATNYIWVRPGMFDPPLVGSGLISRRVIFAAYYCPVNRRLPKALHKISSPNQVPPPNGITKKSKKGGSLLSFNNAEVKIVFQYWQNLGSPFTRHIERESKVTARAMQEISKALKKHERSVIISAIDKCYNLFGNFNFKFKHYYQANGLGLDDFFRFTERKLTRLRGMKHLSSLPRSWFNVCVGHSVKDLSRIYANRYKPKNPQTGDKLIAIWISYRSGVISRAEEDSLHVAGDKLTDYCLKNQIDLSFALNLINSMLNTWRNYAPRHSGWLSSDLFFDSILPEELVRFGVLKGKDRKALRR